MNPATPRLIFTKGASSLILKAFGASINEKGIIIDNATGESILSPEGDELTKDSFGGIKKGSIKFIKNDLLAAINLAENKY